MLTVEDAAGLPVSATVGQDTDTSNATTEGANPACAGAATSGSVTATFR
jgi:hypothetical protein